MTLLRILVTARPDYVARSRRVVISDKLAKHALIPQCDLCGNSCVNILCASNKSRAFQNNHLKNDYAFHIPLPTSYNIKIQCDSRDDLFSYLARRCIVALGQNINKLLPYCLSLTVLRYPSIQVSNGILVDPVLIDAKEHGIGNIGVVFGEVNLG